MSLFYFVSMQVKDMGIVFNAFLVGTGALLVTVVMIITTLTLTGDTFQPTMLINSVLGCYLIGSSVSYYLMKQSERYRGALARVEQLHDELEKAHAKLQKHAKLDIMTGLLNREAFFRKVEALKAENPDQQSAILIADIDNFKLINDTWGHLEGDSAILKVAEALHKTAGADAIVGRIGGEEFAVFLPDGDPIIASEIAELIRKNVEALEFYPVEKIRQPLSLSVGGAMAKNDGVTTDLVRRADRTLYRAKNCGRNQVKFEAPIAA